MDYFGIIKNNLSRIVVLIKLIFVLVIVAITWFIWDNYVFFGNIKDCYFLIAVIVLFVFMYYVISTYVFNVIENIISHIKIKKGGS